MSHISSGELRRLLDRPNELDADRGTHLRECERCRQRMSAVVSDARAAAELVEQPGERAPEAAAALQAIRARGLGRVASAPSSGVLRGMRFRRRTWRAHSRERPGSGDGSGPDGHRGRRQPDQDP